MTTNATLESEREPQGIEQGHQPGGRSSRFLLRVSHHEESTGTADVGEVQPWEDTAIRLETPAIGEPNYKWGDKPLRVPGFRTWVEPDSNRLTNVVYLLGINPLNEEHFVVNSSTVPVERLDEPSSPVQMLGLPRVFIFGTDSAQLTGTEITGLGFPVDFEDYIEIPEDLGRRHEPVIRGKGVSIWAVLAYVNRRGLTPEQVSEQWSGYVTPEEVRAAIFYQREFPELVDDPFEDGA
jgi:uncharacterized protein (DUF433 family)